MFFGLIWLLINSELLTLPIPLEKFPLSIPRFPPVPFEALEFEVTFQLKFSNLIPSKIILSNKLIS